MPSRPGAIHRKIIELLRQHPNGLTSGQIRAKLDLPPDEQAHLDRRKRDLRKWFVLEKRRVGKELLYILKGEREAEILDRSVNIRVRAAVLGRAHGRCQMCGRTVVKHGVVLVVDHKIPVEWGGTNGEENLWAVCEDCVSKLKPHNRAAASKSRRKFFLLPTARARVAALLKARRGRAIPSCWLKAVSSCDDWARCVRSLRSDGWNIVALRSSDRKDAGLPSYTLVSTNA